MGRLPPDVRRRQLLDAGRRLWAAGSYDAVRPADITAATGTSIGLVYHHFGSKRGFYVATVRDVADALIAATAPCEGDRQATAAHMVRAFVAFVEAHGPVLRAVLRGGIGIDPQVDAIAQEVRDTQAARVLQLLGCPQPPERRAMVVGWIGLCEALALDHVDRRRLPPDDLTALMLEALWRLLS